MATVHRYIRKRAEVTIWARAEFRAIIGIYVLDENDDRVGPLDMSAYTAFWAQIAARPGQEPKATIDVSLYAPPGGYTFPGDPDPHPSPLLLIASPNSTSKLQEAGLREATFDIFGLSSLPTRDHLVEAFATIKWASTRDFPG